MLKNGVILVRFDTIVWKNDVIQDGIYHFDNKPFIVKSWNPEMEFTRDELNTVPIWIRFPGLDFKYSSPKALSKIESLVGWPMIVNHNTEKKNGLNFARLLVDVEMGASLPECVRFVNERGMLIEQKVSYDWKPTLCTHCHKYGHAIEICRKKRNLGNQEGSREKNQTAHEVQRAPMKAMGHGVADQGTQKQQGSANIVATDNRNLVPQKSNSTQGSPTRKQVETVWATPQRPGKSQNSQNQQVTKQGNNINSFQVLNHEAKGGIKGVMRRNSQVENVDSRTISHIGNG
nr:uncharacterized protein LOC104096382 [Nicotiana tomentosiformis]